MLTSPGTRLAKLERMAVLSRTAGVGAGGRKATRGRWNFQPDGCYLRDLPKNYSNTVMEIWAPKDSVAIDKEYGSATHIAVPRNTARQRLIQSTLAYRAR
jgi:hypothetical protein